MNNTIWKYPLKIYEVQIISMPATAKVLSVQVQGDVPCIWALVDTDEKNVERTFILQGTGLECTCDLLGYIGTFQLQGGRLVYHLFEE